MNAKYEELNYYKNEEEKAFFCKSGENNEVFDAGKTQKNPLPEYKYESYATIINPPPNKSINVPQFIEKCPSPKVKLN